jgi:hypothetical protein
MNSSSLLKPQISGQHLLKIARKENRFIRALHKSREIKDLDIRW